MAPPCTSTGTVTSPDHCLAVTPEIIQNHYILPSMVVLPLVSQSFRNAVGWFLMALLDLPMPGGPQAILRRGHWGPPGLGKSTKAIKDDPTAFLKDCDTNWWDNHAGQDAVILDGFPGLICQAVVRRPFSFAEHLGKWPSVCCIVVEHIVSVGSARLGCPA